MFGTYIVLLVINLTSCQSKLVPDFYWHINTIPINNISLRDRTETFLENISLFFSASLIYNILNFI